MTLPNDFLFVCCQVGAEAALKKEIARDHATLHFAFSKPGFITFKNTAIESITPEFELRSVFTRAYGKSLRRLDAKQLERKSFAQAVIDAGQALSAEEGKKIRLHLWERDQHKIGEEPLGFEWGVWERDAGREVARALEKKKSPFHAEELAKEGELVLDVIIVDPDTWWLGVHRHSLKHTPYAGGRPKIELPKEAPSRAYLKLEEGILWSRAPVKKGDTAVEIGSAPGGATYALLQRGLNVVGIDPGEMAPVIFKKYNDQFLHIPRPVGTVLREELPEKVEWLLLDMNVSPQVSLFAVSRLALRMRDSLLGLFLTVKMNQWELADQIPEMIEHVKEMGIVRVRATQLSYNKQEIFIHGLTRKGVAKLR